MRKSLPTWCFQSVKKQQWHEMAQYTLEAKVQPTVNLLFYYKNQDFMLFRPKQCWAREHFSSLPLNRCLFQTWSKLQIEHAFYTIAWTYFYKAFAFHHLFKVFSNSCETLLTFKKHTVTLSILTPYSYYFYVRDMGNCAKENGTTDRFFLTVTLNLNICCPKSCIKGF